MGGVGIGVGCGGVGQDCLCFFSLSKMWCPLMAKSSSFVAPQLLQFSAVNCRSLGNAALRVVTAPQAGSQGLTYVVVGAIF